MATTVATSFFFTSVAGGSFLKTSTTSNFSCVRDDTATAMRCRWFDRGAAQAHTGYDTADVLLAS